MIYGSHRQAVSGVAIASLKLAWASVMLVLLLFASGCTVVPESTRIELVESTGATICKFADKEYSVSSRICMADKKIHHCTEAGKWVREDVECEVSQEQ